MRSAPRLQPSKLDPHSAIHSLVLRSNDDRIEPVQRQLNDATVPWGGEVQMKGKLQGGHSLAREPL